MNGGFEAIVLKKSVLTDLDSGLQEG